MKKDEIGDTYHILLKGKVSIKIPRMSIHHPGMGNKSMLQFI
jgi:hypothetical protein